MQSPFEVNYSNDLVIADPAELATLAVFFDRVTLPAGGFYALFPLDVLPAQEEGQTDETQMPPSEKWDLRYAVLFDEGVLQRLKSPSYDDDQHRHLKTVAQAFVFRALVGRIGVAGPAAWFAQHGVDPSMLAVAPEMSVAQVMHWLRDDIEAPKLLGSLRSTSHVQAFAALEAATTFGCLIPQLGQLHPFDIMDLRAAVRATREGFTMHLWQLSQGLKERAQGKSSQAEIEAYARNLIESSLIPQYREFSRQLKSVNAGSRNKILDAAGKIMEITSTPSTPKFWFDLLKALGATFLTSQSERKDELSNKAQAFTFMKSLDGYHPRYSKYI